MPDTPDDVVLTLPVQDGQYHLHTHSSAGEPSWPDTIDGLFVGEDTWLAVLTGTHWGSVTACLRAHDARPATVDPGWDMVAEWTLDIPNSEITIQATYGGGGGTTIITIPGEWARLRVSVRNRRAAAQRGEQGEAFLREPVEEHRIQYWPVSHREDPAVLAGPDDVATMILDQQAQLRREYGAGTV